MGTWICWNLDYSGNESIYFPRYLITCRTNNKILVSGFWRGKFVQHSISWLHQWMNSNSACSLSTLIAVSADYLSMSIQPFLTLSALSAVGYYSKHRGVHWDRHGIAQLCVFRFFSRTNRDLMAFLWDVTFEVYTNSYFAMSVKFVHCDFSFVNSVGFSICLSRSRLNARKSINEQEKSTWSLNIIPGSTSLRTMDIGEFRGW